jgi:hypothetical protein
MFSAISSSVIPSGFSARSDTTISVIDFPSSRSMRENPHAGTEKEGADVLYRGDNEWRAR